MILMELEGHLNYECQLNKPVDKIDMFKMFRDVLIMASLPFPRYVLEFLVCVGS
jgi:hypothetical protein